MSRSFELPDAEWATVGTVGVPGQRTFYLQARQGDQLVTLKLEKQQVAAMAQILSELLSDLPAPEREPAGTELDLAEPVLAEWAVGTMQVAYDAGADRIVILAEEVGAGPVLEEEDEEEEPDDNPIADIIPGDALDDADLAVGRLGITRIHAAAIMHHGIDLVRSGRPLCALCGHPIDPDGHSCPRTNGHRSPAS